jgi:hypothetical protein
MVKYQFLFLSTFFQLIIFPDGQRPAGLVMECMPRWISAWRIPSLPAFMLKVAVLACEGMAARISACRPLLHGQVSISFSFHILSTDYLFRRAETGRFGHGVYATLDFSVAHSISARVQDEGCRFGSEGMAAWISACRPRLHG